MGYIIAFFISVLVCLIFYFLLQWFTRVLVWTMIIGTIAGFAIGGVLAWTEYNNLKDLNED